MFRNFQPRLERDVKKLTSARDDKRQATTPNLKLTRMDVKVVKHKWQPLRSGWPHTAVLGKFHTRAQYQEEGPHSKVLSSVQQSGNVMLSLHVASHATVTVGRRWLLTRERRLWVSMGLRCAEPKNHKQ